MILDEWFPSELLFQKIITVYRSKRSVYEENNKKKTPHNVRFIVPVISFLSFWSKGSFIRYRFYHCKGFDTFYVFCKFWTIHFFQLQ